MHRLPSAALRASQPVQPNLVAQPLQAPIEGRDRRTVGLAHLEARGTRRRNDIPGRIEGAVSQVAGSRVAEPVVSKEHEARAVRTAEPLLAGLAVRDRPASAWKSTSTCPAPAFVDMIGEEFPLVPARTLRISARRHDRTGSPLHMGQSR